MKEVSIKKKNDVKKNVERLVLPLNSCFESPLEKLISLMSSVKIDNPKAELNTTTIADNKGRRILL